MFKRVAVIFAPKLRPHNLSFPGFKFLAHQLLHSLLQRCHSMNHLKQLHAHLIVAAILDETLTLAQLISFCSLSPTGDLRYSCKRLEHAPNPNKFMSNSLIRGYTNQHSPKEALFLYVWKVWCIAYGAKMFRHDGLKNVVLWTSMMRASKIMLDQVTLISVLMACAQNGNLVFGKNIHNQIRDNIEQPSIALFNLLIDMYAKCGPIEIALDLDA
ncbi:pentatricopeptide repeat-containing protein At2g29760, chloroplastic-like [Ananas comosus]|uniref:Pentatricopeptide repeat-containing protein At2g29760, chloroplastic-like n=1 Tax=Ananas comosus TaxID=4615 RepID=A0A6P5F9H8_ANACO|nr:pentatricopeptide repeat-containing protein At2g29760, chloroplastic-like [Ananas comosus]